MSLSVPLCCAQEKPGLAESTHHSTHHTTYRGHVHRKANITRRILSGILQNFELGVKGGGFATMVISLGGRGTPVTASAKRRPRGTATMAVCLCELQVAVSTHAPGTKNKQIESERESARAKERPERPNRRHLRRACTGFARDQKRRGNRTERQSGIAGISVRRDRVGLACGVWIEARRQGRRGRGAAATKVLLLRFYPLTLRI